MAIGVSYYGDNGDYEDCGLLWLLLTVLKRAPSPCLKKKKIKDLNSHLKV